MQDIAQEVWFGRFSVSNSIDLLTQWILMVSHIIEKLTIVKIEMFSLKVLLNLPILIDSTTVLVFADYGLWSLSKNELKEI